MDTINSIEENLKFFKGKHASYLKETKHGLEKESLRITEKGLLSEKRHPQNLGSALFHPNITLDFAEAQLELVTEAYRKVEEALKELDSLQAFIIQNIKNENLWPHSIPCPIEDESKVKLAKFGFTKEGYEKWLYRKGLSLRCGKKMQLLSGIHYNFSFNNCFWKHFHEQKKSKQNLKEFISESYLALSRNFLREGWLTSYLFGATPACDKSFITQKEKPLKTLFSNTLYAPYGTSLRMSPWGYFSKYQLQKMISFNGLEEYRQDLIEALNTAHPFYKKIGLFQEGKKVQINENFLQIEAEYYSRIRPKPYPEIKKRVSEALKEGIGYFEVRNIDIDPFLPLGLGKELLYFKHLFFIYCLFKESPPIYPDEAKIICENQDKVALYGRKEDLNLTCYIEQKQMSFKVWAINILESMKPIAVLLDSKDRRYSKALENQIKKVKDPTLTPSAQQLQILKAKKQDFKQFALSKSKEYKTLYIKKSLPKQIHNHLEKKIKASLKMLSEKEKEDEDVLYGYEDLEPSTQMIIREAYIQDYKVKILDRRENFISIDNGKKEVFVKQATQTEKDNLISYFAMKSKVVTQKILKENKLNCTSPCIYYSAKEALKDYVCFQDKKIVIKPNHANFGEKVFFIEPYQKEDFIFAVESIEKMKDDILIETFFEGEEYRFLVIGNQVVAVSKREPANIIGDGKSSIEKLINQKNKSLKSFQKPFPLNDKALAFLKQQGLSLKDILKKGRRVYLRQNSNVSTGGESIDQTEKVLVNYKNIALKAAKALKAKITGVDMLIQDIKQKPNKTNYVLLELNHNPALFIHRFPSYGEKKYVEKDLLNYLFN